MTDSDNTQRVDVARLSELLEKATPGPWAATVNGHVKRVGGEIVLNPQMNLGDKRHDNADLIAEGINALPALLQQLAELQAKTACTLGVGDGSGQLFVHGDYESIKAVQAIIDRLAERDAEIERLGEELDVANTALGQATTDCVEASFRAEAAERDREGACGLLRECDTVAKVRGMLGVPDCIDNHGQPYQSAHLAAFLAANGGSDA